MRQKLQSRTFFLGDFGGGTSKGSVTFYKDKVESECSHDQCRGVSSQKADENFGGNSIHLMIKLKIRESSTVKFL